VDEICTSGRSLDTARAYITAAGASAMLFCWLKTINTDFLSMEPTPALDPFEQNAIVDEPRTKAYSYSQKFVDDAAALEVPSLLKRFRA
jgi:hypothetical protein